MFLSPQACSIVFCLILCGRALWHVIPVKHAAGEHFKMWWRTSKNGEIRAAKMSGRSYFTIQIQSRIVKTQSKSNYSPKTF